MYPKKRLINSGIAPSGSFAPCVDRECIARRLSYYVNGGVDLEGVSNRPPVESHFDNPEDIASDTLDITSDPTVSKLDIAEYASMQYADASSKRSAEKFTDTPDDNSD
jgi:hypothetical protein